MAIKRQQIIDYMKTKLAEITTANGYYTNIGSKVYEWKANPFETNEVPGIEIRDLEENISDVRTSGNYNLHNHELNIELRVVCSETTPITTVRKMITDVNKLIGIYPTWNDYAIYTYPIGNKIEVDQQGVFVGQATVIIQVQYRTTAWSEA